MKKLLTIQNLSTGYRLKRGETIVLHKSLYSSLNEGEFVGVLGPNGAGKSTLLKTLLGFIPKLEGKISYGDKRLEDISVREMATKVSVVLTDKIDDIYLTAEEVIAAARYPYISFAGKLSEKDNEKINNAVLLTGITDLLPRKFYTLSDGEKQRVMIARALAQDTPLIFLDEPTSGVDPVSRKNFWLLIYSLAARGKTIFVTTHFMDEAEYCNRVSIMREGRIVELDDPVQLKRRYNADSMQQVFMAAVKEKDV